MATTTETVIHSHHGLVVQIEGMLLVVWKDMVTLDCFHAFILLGQQLDKNGYLDLKIDNDDNLKT